LLRLQTRRALRFRSPRALACLHAALPSSTPVTYCIMCPWRFYGRRHGCGGGRK
jgi:hypothetical protein